MEKVLNISGRDVPFKSSGAFLMRYKFQFGRDAMGDLGKLSKVFEKKEDEEEYELKEVEALDLEVFFNMVWTLAKTADPSIPPPMEWLDGFDDFPIAEVLPELMDVMFANFATSIDSKKKASGLKTVQ